MDFVGYAEISKEAKINFVKKPNLFVGKVCRVLEFGVDSVLVVDEGGEELAMVEYEGVKRSFKCGFVGNSAIIPPNLDTIQTLEYYCKLMSRKGGYNNLLRNMVIQLSLSKGVYSDNFLWQKQ